MTTMRAVLLKGHGGYEQLDYREDVAIPVPGPDDVLVRVGAAGVNNTDINTRIGWYTPAVTLGTSASSARAAPRADELGWNGTGFGFPRIQGADACGRITAVGANVDAARIGERVLVEPIFRESPAGRGEIKYFGSECDGAFADFTCVPAAQAHPISSALSDAELASFPCAYGAAENMVARLGLEHGQTVLITGASGGVGSAAVQLAKRRGARVIAMTGAGKAASVMALGAAAVISRGESPVALLGRESVDAVIDVVGGDEFPGLLDVLRRGGRYAVAGAIAGPKVQLDLRTLYLKDLSLFGCTVFAPAVFTNLIGYIERGEIVPVIAAIHPLSAIVAAQQEFLDKRHTGKIVLVP